MAGSNNFVQFNPTKANQETDAQYTADSLRANGIPILPNGVIIPSLMLNKALYQSSTMANAIGEMMKAKGYAISDADVSALIPVIAEMLTVADILGLSTKITPADLDTLIMRDSDASNAMKVVTVASLLGRIQPASLKQAVLYGATDANGYANFLSVGTGLSVNIAATAVPIRVSLSAGLADYTVNVSADTSIGSLQANATLYLYLDRNASTGAISYGYSEREPFYGLKAPATLSDQHWFHTGLMKMFRWTGAAWEEKQRIFLGECTTGPATVTSVVTYQIKGYYDSGWTNTGYVSTGFSHNLGCFPADSKFYWRWSGAPTAITDNSHYAAAVGNGSMATLLSYFTGITRKSITLTIEDPVTSQFSWPYDETRVICKRGW